MVGLDPLDESGDLVRILHHEGCAVDDRVQDIRRVARGRPFHNRFRLDDTGVETPERDARHRKRGHLRARFQPPGMPPGPKKYFLWGIFIVNISWAPEIVSGGRDREEGRTRAATARPGSRRSRASA
jgi:hypothetical protein